MNEKLGRRSLLAGAGAATAGALAGCLGSIPGLGGGDGNGAGASGAEDWPLPRGSPGNSGRSASGGPGPDASNAVTATLSDGIRPQQWTAPTVGSDGVYAIANERDPYGVQPPRFRLYVYRFSRTDGTETWRRVLRERQGTGATRARDYGGPALSADGVLVTWGEGERYNLHVASLSPEDGTTNWSRTVAEGAARSWSPVVHDGTVYCTDGRGAVLALSVEDGSERWRSPEIALGQRFPSVGDQGVVVYNLGPNAESDGRITLYDREDGTERWTRDYPEGRLPFPTIDGDTVYVAEGGSRGLYGNGYEVPPRDVHALSVEDGSERWSRTYDTEAIREAITPGGTATVTVDGDHVYYALGFPSTREFLGYDPSQENLERVRSNQYEGPNVVALDRSDGSVVWETQVGTTAHVFQPMAVGPDRLYAQYRGLPEDESDRTRIYVLDRASGEVLGQIGPVEDPRPFAVADGTLFTHTGSRIRMWE